MEMQIKQKSELDARRFTEIFSTLNDTERQVLCEAIAKKTGASKMAISYWNRGERKPRLLSTKRAIADAVKSSLGLNVSVITLFQ